MLASRPFPSLYSKRLCLRPLRASDAEDLFPAFCDEDNMRYWSRGPIATPAAMLEYMTWNLEGDNVCCYAITTKEIDRAFGWVAHFDHREGEREMIGYILRPDHHGMRYGVEAVSRVLENAFTLDPSSEVRADIDPENLASRYLLTRLGFAREKYLVASWRTHLGVRDSEIYWVDANSFVPHN